MNTAVGQDLRNLVDNTFLKKDPPYKLLVNGLNKILNMENKQRCICCGSFTLEGEFDICPVCFWQKDFFQEENIDDNGGPNLVSLREAKENFKSFGAIEKRFINLVRPPSKEEMTE